MVSCAWLLASALPAVVASSTPERFLQQRPQPQHHQHHQHQAQHAHQHQKQLGTAEDFIRQLNFSVTDSTYCNKTETYTVSENVYGLIRGPVTDGLTTLYPSDKAVTWLSGSESLKSWLDGCCDLSSNFTDGLKKCLNFVADAVQIDKQDGASYQIAALDRTADLKPIPPTWTNFGTEDVLPKTYPWVFGDLERNNELALSISELQQQCKPPTGTWSMLEKFYKPSPGVDAYKAIVKDSVYGVSGQMGNVSCSATVSNYSDGCQCRGEKGHYCTTDDDVKLFCKWTAEKKCDPRPFLCPTGSDDPLPVGYVRAYLHKFLDAVPAFQGTGYTTPERKTKEYILVPNREAKDAKVTVAECITGCH